MIYYDGFIDLFMVVTLAWKVGYTVKKKVECEQLLNEQKQRNWSFRIYQSVCPTRNNTVIHNYPT